MRPASPSDVRFQYACGRRRPPASRRVRASPRLKVALDSRSRTYLVIPTVAGACSGNGSAWRLRGSSNLPHPAAYGRRLLPAGEVARWRRLGTQPCVDSTAQPPPPRWRSRSRIAELSPRWLAHGRARRSARAALPRRPLRGGDSCRPLDILRRKLSAMRAAPGISHPGPSRGGRSGRSTLAGPPAPSSEPPSPRAASAAGSSAGPAPSAPGRGRPILSIPAS